jgi:hypothetical protein
MDRMQARTELSRSGYLSSNAVITGLTLFAVGGLVGALGMGISGTAMMRSFRSWITALQQQPVQAFAQNEMIPAKPTPAKTAPAKTASNLSGGPKEMATPSSQEG